MYKICLKLITLCSILALPLLFVNCGTNKARSTVAYSDGFGVGNHKFSFSHNGLTRTYQVHVPASYNKTQATPVVIYLHGGGGSASSAFTDGLDTYSDKHGFILAIPEGTGETDSSGTLKASWNGGAWATGECCGAAEDVSFISSMIDQLKIDFKINEKKIYATGISNGGLMTNRLACDLSNKIAAIATVAPAAILSSCHPGRAVPYMHIHGKQDRCNDYYTGLADFSLCNNVPYTRMNAASVVDVWRNLNACTNQSIQSYQKADATCVTYNQCQNNSTVSFCTVDAMGHTWPSGSQYLPAFMIGPVNNNISTDQIWDFFKEHSL